MQNPRDRPTILVTGAAGFIGSHTCDQLVARGCRVVAVDDLSRGRRENLAAAEGTGRLEFIAADISEPGFCDAVVAALQPAAIIHLAGSCRGVAADRAERDANRRLNFVATRRIADAAAAGRVRRVVFASSAAVYGRASPLAAAETDEPNPLDAAAEAKLLSERLLMAAGEQGFFSAFCLRYFNVYGPRQDAAGPHAGVVAVFGDRLRRDDELPVHGDGEQTRDFVSVYDVARANADAALSSHTGSVILNVCTGRDTSIRVLAGELGAILRRAPRLRHERERPGDVRHSVGAVERAAVRLGFRAAVSLESGLADLWGIRAPMSARPLAPALPLAGR